MTKKGFIRVLIFAVIMIGLMIGINSIVKEHRSETYVEVLPPNTKLVGVTSRNTSQILMVTRPMRTDEVAEEYSITHCGIFGNSGKFCIIKETKE